MKLGILMDSLDSLAPNKDSTVAMIQSAHALGWDCCYFTQKDLVCREGRAFASLYNITAIDEKQPAHAKTQPLGEQALATLDIILMRKDPPFDIEYIYATYALELAAKEGVLIANNPQSLRDVNEKWYTFQFPACCPSTLVSQSMGVLRGFWERHQNVIFKPLCGMGGSSVFHVDKSGHNLSVILETLTDYERRSIMAQQYIPEISSLGDKRILLINGKPIPYGLARIPAKGELRGNLAAGARGEVVALTARDYWICDEIAPVLREKGLYFVGIDVIGDYLTEINVTSPTCIREISKETGIDIATALLNCLAQARKGIGL